MHGGAPSPDGRPEGTVREVAGLFLKLGTVAFGGPAAHIAMMHDECVKRRKWVTDEEFTDLLGAASLIPGPNSTELAIHLGVRRAGWLGLAAAGLFILPAVAIVLAFAWAYVRFGDVPAVEHLLVGVKPVMIAIVVQAMWNLRRVVAKDTMTVAAAGLALGLHLWGINELVLLLGLGVVVMTSRRAETRAGRGPPAGGAGAAAAIPLAAGSGFVAASGSGLLTLFLTFLKIGAVLYGSGYVLITFLEGDFVHRLGWLTQTQLLDAVAVGQVTPGPVFTTATFIGYVVGSWPGAAVATVGIFLPSFAFVAATWKVVPKLRGNPWSAGFLDGVSAAAIGLMASVTWTLGGAAIVDPWTATIGYGALIALLGFRVNATWVILAGGVAGLLTS